MGVGLYQHVDSGRTGSGGASLLDICLAQERLAQGDGATALAVNMHLGLLWVMGDLWRADGETGHDLLAKVAQDRLIVSLNF